MTQKAVLLPYQQRWVADTAAVKVAEKSRRIGLTWAEAADDALIAAAKDGTDVWYIGYNKEMAREFIDACGMWARAYSLAAGDIGEVAIADADKDILAYRITFASGHTITALSSRPRDLRGKQGVVVIDEAAFHDDLEGLIKAAIALLMWGGKVRIISSHNGEDNPFNELVQEIRKGRKSFSLHTITIHDAVKDGLYRRICEVKGIDWSEAAEAAWLDSLFSDYGDNANEELLCIPAGGDGYYFPLFLLEKAMRPVPVIRWGMPSDFAAQSDAARRAVCEAWCRENLDPLLSALDKSKNHYFGEDFGRSGDRSVVWPIAESANLTYETPFVLEMHNIPFRQQEQVLFHVVDGLPHFTFGALDARGNGQAQAEYAQQRYGASRIAQVMLTRGFYQEAWPKYKAALEDTAMTLPRDADIRNDHRSVRLVKGIPDIPDSARTKASTGGLRHGDSAVAGMLAKHATGMGGARYSASDVKTTEKRRESAKLAKEY